MDDNPAEYEELRRLLQETHDTPWPTIEDRDAWERLAATRHGSAISKAALADAETFASGTAIPHPSLTDFLRWSREGDRQTWEAAAARLSHRMDALVLAACFTGEQRWIEGAADALWALAEMATWSTPAHEDRVVPDSENPTVELWSAMRAQDMAEALQLLQPALDHMDTGIARHLHRELDRRVFTPFLARSDWWWLWPHDRPRLNNWTAVCSGSVLCAALAALKDDPERQARIVQKAAWSLAFFRDTFDRDGGLDEGVGYWSYGVSYFVMAAERLAARTRGRRDLLADPFWKQVARFPLKVRLYGDTFVNFSDCPSTVIPIPGWLYWLGQRMELPELQQWALRLMAPEHPGQGEHHRYLPFVLRTLAWIPASAVGRAAAPEAPAHNVSWLGDVEWLVARVAGSEESEESEESEDALVLAAKGGHNAENHNHNDIGSFMVHWRQEALVAELGAPSYNRAFFSAERYQNIAARSLGHSIPLVNGQEQLAGREYAAREVRFVQAENSAELSLDLTGCYGPEAALQTLTRHLALVNEGGGRVRLTDRAMFDKEGATLAVPLISLGTTLQVREAGTAEIIGERGKLVVNWNPEEAACHAEEVPTADPGFCNAAGDTVIRRLWFEVTVRGKEARLQLTLTPTEKW